MPAIAMKTGMVTIAAMVVKDTIPADSSASRPNLVASIVVMAALDAEVAIRQETAMVLSKPRTYHITSAMIGEMIIFIEAAT